MVEQFAEPPTYFFDTLVWSNLGKDSELAEALAAFLRAEGATLVYTAPLLVELGRIQDEVQQARIRDFANQFPCAFFDSNAIRVEQRDRRGEQTPQFNMPLIRQAAEAVLSQSRAGVVTPCEALDDVFHPDHLDRLNRQHDTVLQPFLDLMKRARQDPAAARERRRVRRGLSEFPPHAVPAMVAEAAFDFPGINPMDLNENHAWDVAMFSVPACYCTVTVVDKQWRDFFDREAGWLGLVGRVIDMLALRRMVSTS